MDTGNSSRSKDAVTQASQNIIKYFLAALTIPEDKVWVNLSPFEGGCMIDNDLGGAAYNAGTGGKIIRRIALGWSASTV